MAHAGDSEGTGAAGNGEEGEEDFKTKPHRGTGDAAVEEEERTETGHPPLTNKVHRAFFLLPSCPPPELSETYSTL